MFTVAGNTGGGEVEGGDRKSGRGCDTPEVKVVAETNYGNWV